MFNLSASVPANVLMIAHSHGTTFTGMEGNRSLCLDVHLLPHHTYHSHVDSLHLILLQYVDILVWLMLFVGMRQVIGH